MLFIKPWSQFKLLPTARTDTVWVHYNLFLIRYISRKPCQKMAIFSLPLFWQGGFLLHKLESTIQAHMDAQCIVPGCIFCFPIRFQHFFQRLFDLVDLFPPGSYSPILVISSNLFPLPFSKSMSIYQFIFEILLLLLYSIFDLVLAFIFQMLFAGLHFSSLGF